MNKQGFFPSDVQATGKIVRFRRDREDKGQSAWYICHQNNTRNGGEVFYVALFGDWHEQDNIYKYCSLKSQSTQDRKDVEDIIRKAEKKRLQEQERVWEETSKKANEIWPGLEISIDSVYYKNKQISDPHGTRMKDGIIHVPVCDADGKIWGLQKIYADGKKFFLTGTKKRGNFHVLRKGAGINNGENIYVCEGFATGASIHQATNQTVVVAFDSGNLEPVCDALRAKYDQSPLIICGDDDVFTKRPDGTPFNAGRDKATSAAQKYLGEAIFPNFRSLDGGPTDFNDLYVREGSDEVKKQVLKAKPEKHYIVPLGHRNLTYFYTSNVNKQIIPLTAHSADGLMNLQPLAYWEQLYKTKMGVDWQQAASDLKHKCHIKGIFNPQRVRGLGVWVDNDRVVVHLGNRLFVDGKEIGLHDLKTTHIYSLEETRPSIVGEPLESTRVLQNVIQNIAWARSQDVYFFSGWLVTALLSGVLQWRPHLWLIGSTGAGKSRIYEIISKVMGGHVTTLAGGTSEAGLRRSVRGSALPLIFDEFELNDNSTMQENQKILAFMRQASSDSTAQIIKADQGGGTVAYQPRFCAFVAGIRPSFTNEADRNRFTLIELDKTKQNKEQWGIVKENLAKIDAQYATDLFLRCLSLIDVYRKSIDVFESSIADRYYARFAQQYAPIFAGYWILNSDRVVTKFEADDYVESIDLSREVSDIKDQNDEQEALSILMHSKVRCGDMGDRAILEIIAGAKSYDATADQFHNYLQRYGMRITDDGLLFVASRHPELSRIFDNTRFQVNWNYSLSRLPGARNGSTARLLGKTAKGVALPLNLLNN